MVATKGRYQGEREVVDVGDGEIKALGSRWGHDVSGGAGQEEATKAIGSETKLRSGVEQCGDGETS